ncbi:MAG: ankyrin repeat domain-containing protein [Gammaproteobacteria bacterium]
MTSSHNQLLTNTIKMIDWDLPEASFCRYLGAKGQPIKEGKFLLIQSGYLRPLTIDHFKVWSKGSFQKSTYVKEVSAIINSVAMKADFDQARINKNCAVFASRYLPSIDAKGIKCFAENGHCQGHSFIWAMAILFQILGVESPLSLQQVETAYTLLSRGGDEMLEEKSASLIKPVVELIHRTHHSLSIQSIPNTDWNRLSTDLKPLYSVILPFTEKHVEHLIKELLLNKTPAETAENKNSGEYDAEIFSIAACGHASFIIKKTHRKTGKLEFIFADSNNCLGLVKDLKEEIAIDLLKDMLMITHSFKTKMALRVQVYGIKPRYLYPNQQMFLSKVNLDALTQEAMFALVLGSIQINCRESFEYWIKHVKELTRVSNKGVNLLNTAAARGRSEILERLIAMGLKPLLNYAKPQSGRTALHAAVRRDFPTTVALLLRQGAFVDVKLKPSATKFPGCSALHIAVAYGRYEIVKLLLAAGAVTSVQDVAGNTPLHLAAEKGDQRLVELLLAKGADPLIKRLDGKLPQEVTKVDAIYRLIGKFAVTKKLLGQLEFKPSEIGFLSRKLKAVAALVTLVEKSDDRISPPVKETINADPTLNRLLNEAQELRTFVI